MKCIKMCNKTIGFKKKLITLFLLLLSILISLVPSSHSVCEHQIQQQQQEQHHHQYSENVDNFSDFDGDCGKWNAIITTTTATATIAYNYFIRLKRKREAVLDVRWAIIDEEVDAIIPLVLRHLKQTNLEYITLPNIREHISVRPLLLTYNAQLELTNGRIYNLSFIKRYGHAYMTYTNRTFQIQFYLNIGKLQFVYDFILKLLTVVNGYGKIVGTMDNIKMFLHLGLDVRNYKMYVYDFRLTKYRKLQVNLDESAHLIRDISGIILTPITNLFRERVITSISDNLKEQFQMIMDDFNKRDPLELHKFTQQILGGLTRHANITKTETE